MKEKLTYQEFLKITKIPWIRKELKINSLSENLILFLKLNEKYINFNALIEPCSRDREVNFKITYLEDVIKNMLTSGYDLSFENFKKYLNLKL